MKTLLALIFCFGFLLSTNAQDSNLNGTWNLVEFTMDNNGNKQSMNEQKLKEDGSAWDIFFMEDAKFRQTSNMSGSGTMDTYEGTWKTSGNNINLELIVDGQKVSLAYTYKLTDNLLTLERHNPAGTMKITAAFRKKL